MTLIGVSPETVKVAFLSSLLTLTVYHVLRSMLELLLASPVPLPRLYLNLINLETNKTMTKLLFNYFFSVWIINFYHAACSKILSKTSCVFWISHQGRFKALLVFNIIKAINKSNTIFVEHYSWGSKSALCQKSNKICMSLKLTSWQYK